MVQQALNGRLPQPRLLKFATRCDPRWIAILLAACFFAASVFDISTYPLVGADEPVLNDPALQLATTGQLRSDVLRENPGFSSHYLLHPPGLTFATAASYRAFGFGIWQTRLPAILFGSLGIALLFILIRNVTQRTLPALLAAMALFAWPEWVLTAKIARMDTGAICFLLMASILVHRSIRSAAGFQPAVLFLAGLCVSAASTFHVASFTWALALLATVLYFSKRRFWAAAVYCIGASLLIGAWLVFALVHFDAFQNQLLFIILGRTGSGGILSRFVEEGARYLHESKRVAAIALPLALAVTGFVITRPWKERSIQFLLMLAGSLAVANAVIAGKGSGYYTLYPMTLGLGIMAIGIANCIEQASSVRYRYLSTIAFFSFGVFLANAFAISYGPRLLAAVNQRPERNYVAQFAPLSTLLKPNDQVWGTGVAWYAIVKAGARLDIQPFTIPLNWDSRPDATRHKYVVVARDAPPPLDGFVKLRDFGSLLPPVMGSRLSDTSYVFSVWKSQSIR